MLIFIIATPLEHIVMFATQNKSQRIIESFSLEKISEII